LTTDRASTPPRSAFWNVLIHPALPGTLNLAVDEVLLDSLSSTASPPATYLRFYQWDRPTLSLGFSQKAERVVDFDFCKSHGIAIIRRPTGGRAVLHHRELTYAVVSNDLAFFPLAAIPPTYKKIATALKSGFRYLNLETEIADTPPSEKASVKPSLAAACFAATSHYELSFQGRKLVGSAQRRTQNAFLQHGSIPIHFDERLLQGALGSGTVSTLESQVTDLGSCLGNPPGTERVIEALLEGFRDVFQVSLRRAELSRELLAKAKVLGQSKYGLLDWQQLPKMP
jgi:lipoyl(octanoyl) transferase